MIENIELYEDDKIQLKHLSIEKRTSLNKLMTKGAEYILQNDFEITLTPPDHEYTTYTMNVSSDLKNDIRKYVDDRGIKIRDFWVQVSRVILEKEGEL